MIIVNFLYPKKGLKSEPFNPLYNLFLALLFFGIIESTIFLAVAKINNKTDS